MSGMVLVGGRSRWHRARSAGTKAPLAPTGGGCGRRGLVVCANDPATGQELLDYIAQIDKIFWETKQA